MTLCRRVVIMLCLCDGVLVRTKNFGVQPQGSPTTTVVGKRNPDEVVVIDVTPVERRAENRHLFYEAVGRYAEECFVPITVGGGIRTVDEVRLLMRDYCADKVVIGSSWLRVDPTRPSAPSRLAWQIVEKFGRQAFVLAVNHHEPHQPQYNGAAGVHGFVSLYEPGEVLLNSIDRDGSLQGYDLVSLRELAAGVDIPVMVAGGCGAWRHMSEAFEAGASAACTSVIHHLTETSLAACKGWLVANCKERVRAAA